MPKVEKLRSKVDGSPGDALREAGPMALDGPEPAVEPLQPLKPKFAPLSAHEQNGKRLDFRRVRQPMLDCA